VSNGVGRHIRGNVVGYVALFLALTMGGAWAAGLGPNSVKSKHIKPGAVKSSDVRNDKLTGDDVNEATLNLPAGPQGPAGSPDTPAQVLAKLLEADGAGSGLDADTLDGSTASAFLQNGAAAGGDLTGTYPNPTIGANAVGAAEVTNPVRSVNLPLGGMQETTGGATIDFTADDGTAPNFVLQPANGQLVIEWDDNTTGAADTDMVGSTFTVPADYASGGTFAVRISKDGHGGVAEGPACRISVNGAVEATDTLAGIPTAALSEYLFTPSAAYSPGSSVGFECRAHNNGAADDVVFFHSMEWRYNATQ
jgi:hypothetical protein